MLMERRFLISPVEKSIYHQLPRAKENVSCVHSMAWELIGIESQTMVANL